MLNENPVNVGSKIKKILSNKGAVYAVSICFFIVLFTYLTKKSFYEYYLVRKIDNIDLLVFVQTFIVSVFWISTLSFSFLLYLNIKRKARIIPLIVWGSFFLVNIIFWFVNLKFVYYSGIEITPFLTTQAKGSSDMVMNSVKNFSVIFWTFYIILMSTLSMKMVRHVKKTPKISAVLLFSPLVGLFFLSLFASSFRNLQEYIVPSNFLSYYAKASDGLTSAEGYTGFLEKLKRFGIEYDFNRENISYHEAVYNPSEKPLLKSELIKNKPNVLIVFLESFSNDATSIYNPKLPGITPNLEKMADNPNTTLFKHYYNASTPTLTGLISQLCSFIPPTGNEDMKDNGTLVNHHLMCLPDILKKNGYSDAFYVNAVEKSFSNKDKVLVNAGLDFDRIYGTKEIAALVKSSHLEKSVGTKPLSWGYSDHQLYPVFQKLIEESKKRPFLGMLSTIDTHVPYTNSKDAIKYPPAPKNDALNAFYTADDAFGEFWDYFINSDLKDNTILIAVADHAVFPVFYKGMQNLFDGAKDKSFFDETLFMMYTPDSILPKSVETLSSGIDFTPTLLQVLGINPSNIFEGHSIFYNRKFYPNVLGSNEFQLYINQLDDSGERKISFDAPKFIAEYADKDETGNQLTLNDYLSYYNWKRKMLEEGRLWEKDLNSASSITPPRFIAHAGGGVNGLTYTNSLEAFNQNYSHNFRFFETDISWTSDNHLVLIHDWDQTYKKLFNREDGAPDLKGFSSTKMNNSLTQMTVRDLFKWLDSHKDAKIITDVKEDNIEALKYISQSDYRDYFIVQVYSEDEIPKAEKLGYKNIILTLYNSDYESQKVIDISQKYDLFAITMNLERATKDNLLKKLNKKNVRVYLHTMNNAQELPSLESLGADGFYTDFITPESSAK